MIMNSFSSEKSQSRSQDNSEVLVNVIVKQETDGRTIAIVPGLPELYIEASDRTTALEQLQERLENHLAGAEIVSLAIKLPSQKQKNPWLEMAGIFKNDPQFDQMLEAIETYRRELDENIENDFQQK